MVATAYNPNPNSFDFSGGFGNILELSSGPLDKTSPVPLDDIVTPNPWDIVSPSSE